MNTKHTPGPWKVASPNAANGFNIYALMDERIGHTVGYEPRPGSKERTLTSTEAEANARLIAAAPELLEACKAVLQWAKTPGDHGGNPYCHEFVKMAEAAIAKAEEVDK